MTTLMQASRQWSSRPADERFLSLHEMASRMHSLRDRSRAVIDSTRKIELFPDDTDATHRGLMLGIGNGSLSGVAMAPTHFSFGQLCSLAFPGNSPAGYFRESRVPAPIIADALNHNLRFTRAVEEIGVLASLGDDTGSGVPSGTLRAATGPGYGRVWNADVVDMLIEQFGGGVSGDWRVPGGMARRWRAAGISRRLRLGQPTGCHLMAGRGARPGGRIRPANQRRPSSPSPRGSRSSGIGCLVRTRC